MSNLLIHDNIETSPVIYDYVNNRSEKDRDVEIGWNVNAANLASVHDEAQRIIDEAVNCAADVKAEAEKTRESIYKEAKAAGFKVGFKVAAAEIEKGNQQVLEEIKRLAINLDEQMCKLIEENEQNIINFAVKIAEKALNQKLASDEEIFVRIYEKAVKDLTAQKWLKISISSAEVQFVTANSGKLLNMVSGAERLEIKVLDNAPAGTCIVETTDMIVDASIATQLNVLRKSLSSKR